LQQQRLSSDTSYSKFHGYAYDAVWAIALAVDSVVTDRAGRYDAGDFRGAGRLLHAALNQTDFLGVTVSPVNVTGAGWPWHIVVCLSCTAQCPDTTFVLCHWP